MVMFNATLLIGQPFTSSGKEKEKQTPTKNEETVSEQVRGVAQQQGVYTIVEKCMYPQSNVGL